MAKKTSTPAKSVRAMLDQAIREGEGRPGFSFNPNVKASEQAQRYAFDHGIPLKGIRGTGHEGKITVPDIEKVGKAMKAKGEKPEPPAAQAVAKSAPAAKKKAKVQAAAYSAADVSGIVALASLRPGIDKVHHMVRSIHEFGMGWDQPIVSGQQADENIGRYLEDGWRLIHVQSLNMDTDGIRMLWVVATIKPEFERLYPRYREIMHVVRFMGSMGDDGRGLTGLVADEYINAFLEDGWDWAYVNGLGMGLGGVNTMWILMR